MTLYVLAKPAQSSLGRFRDFKIFAFSAALYSST